MKLFKKVLAVVLVGAMAVSMLTACGSSLFKRPFRPLPGRSGDGSDPGQD